MNEDVPVVLTGRTRRWWDVLRLGLILLWLLGAATTWWTAPRKQSYDQARADVAAGRVTAYQWGDRWDGDGPRSWFGAVDETSYSGQGAVGIAQDIRAAGLEERSGGTAAFSASVSDS